MWHNWSTYQMTLTQNHFLKKEKEKENSKSNMTCQIIRYAKWQNEIGYKSFDMCHHSIL